MRLQVGRMSSFYFLSMEPTLSNALYLNDWDLEISLKRKKNFMSDIANGMLYREVRDLSTIKSELFEFCCYSRTLSFFICKIRRLAITDGYRRRRASSINNSESSSPTSDTRAPMNDSRFGRLPSTSSSLQNNFRILKGF